MSKPQIALLHYTAAPIIGGVENVVSQHARLFHEAGYPVTLVAGRGSSDEAFARSVVIPELDSGSLENLQIARALETGHVPADFYTLQSRVEHLLAPHFGQADIVVAHNVFNFHFNLPLTAALHGLIDRGAIKKLIVWCHDTSRFVNPSSGTKLRFGFPWDLLRTFRPEVTYVTVSQQRQRTLAQVLGCPPEDIRVVPNGVDPMTLLGLSSLGQHLVEEFRLLEADLIALMPIRITRAKNIEFALKVTAALKASDLHPRLLVTGPPDPHAADISAYCDGLLAERRELGVEDEVIFAYSGTSQTKSPLMMNPSAVAELYRVCDLVLMPSHREGFGMPVIEGGLVGKPIFATAIPALEEVGRDSVYVIEPGESPAQVAARIRLWAQQDITHRLRRRVRQEYTWPSVFSRMIEPLIVGAGKPAKESL